MPSSDTLPETWTTKDGRVLRIKDMETSHIRNTLRMLARKKFISRGTLESYFVCARPNGEMAQDAFDSELCEAMSRPVSPHIDAFEDELAARGEAEDAF